MRTPVTLSAALLLGFAAAARAQQPPASTLDAVATRIVNASARVAQGDIVLIRGNTKDQDLLERLAVKVRARGAFPIVSCSTDALTRAMFDDVPAELDSQLNAADVRLATMVNAVIIIDRVDNPSLLNHVPPARLAARARADAAAWELLRRARVRTVVLGGGLFPTAATANQYALTQDELARMFWDAALAQPAGLDATGQVVRQSLAGKEARITNPNGTDIRFRIEGRRAWVNDGELEEPAPGQPAPPLHVTLPAGDVSIVPVPGTAEGRVVADTLTYRGREITGLTLVFKAGRVTSMNAKTGIEALRQLYDAAGPGKEQLAYLQIGVNGLVRLPAGVKINAPMPAGMITLGIGNNLNAGGENASPFAAAVFLPGCTLKVDDQAVVDAGRLVMPTSPDEDPESPPPGPATEPEPGTP